MRMLPVPPRVGVMAFSVFCPGQGGNLDGDGDLWWLLSSEQTIQPDSCMTEELERAAFWAWPGLI